jgi:heme/copper-type cytochrome/quinol oxidase subunit 2
MPVIEKRDLLKGATTLVIALAWNEAAKKTIGYTFPFGGGPAGEPLNTETSNKQRSNDKAATMATILYAVVVTVIIICIISLFNYTTTKIEVRDDDMRTKNNDELKAIYKKLKSGAK